MYKNIILRYFSKKYRKPHSIWTKDVNKFNEDKKYLWMYNLGLLGIVFGCCYLTVPLYRLFCQETGLEGTDQSKDYSKLKKRKKISKSYNINFKADVDPDLKWEFEPIQNEVKVDSSETALMFYRAKNNDTKPIIGIAVYTVYPEYLTNYFSKVQCFCFNQQLINPGEELQLPLYFYLEPEIDDDPIAENITDISILYRFFPTKNQDFANLINEENKREYERRKYLRNKRIEKRKLNNEDIKDLLQEEEIDKSLFN